MRFFYPRIRGLMNVFCYNIFEPSIIKVMKLNLFYALLFALLLSNTNLHAQNVGINNAAPDPTALLDLFSTDKGLLIPRLSSAQRTGIAGPAHGLLVFDTTLDLFFYSDNGLWVPLLSGRNGWSLVGNSGTNPTTNFIGTTDAQPLVFKTALAEHMRITATGDVGIGTATPLSKLHVNGDIATMTRFLASDGNSFLPSITFITDLTTGLYKPTSGVIGVATSGFERARFDANGLILGFPGQSSGRLTFQNLSMPGALHLSYAPSFSTYGLVFPPAQGALGQVLKNDGAGNLFWDDDLGTTSNWALSGNTGTNPTTNFIGTSDNVDVVFRTANVERMRINALGNVGIGTGNPAVSLHVQGNFRLADGTQGAGKLLVSDLNGSASWNTLTGIFSGKVANGIYFNTTLERIHLGGALTENTTITGSGFDFTHDLTGAGDFQVSEASSATPALFVTGNKGTLNDGNVGIGTNTPVGKFHINLAASTIAANFNSYHLLLGTANANPDLTLGANAVFALVQSWNNKPLVINSQGSFVGINSAASPIQNLDINGRLAVQSGVIQRGITTINATSDLGLYQQTAGATMRFANNAAPIKFYLDQGGANSAGTNAIMSVDNANGGAVKIHSETSGLGNAGVPSANAALDIQSTSKGVFFPRMTTAQRDAIAPATTDAGLMIYNLDQNCINWWDTRTNTSGAAGFWNNQCEPCQDFFVYAASSNGNIFNTQVGSPNRPKVYCVTINTGVTLGASVIGGAALNFGTLPAGSKVILTNYGTIKGGGGNGGVGGSERDNICLPDIAATAGANGGDAIITSANVQVVVNNYGTIAGGGGGGGGGAGGCRSTGGSGGGGAGIPAGAGGIAPAPGQKVSGILCNVCIGSPAALAGGLGNAFTGGIASCSIGNAGGGCFATGSNGGCGGNGGGLGANGNAGVGTTCGTATLAIGGSPGNALRGNGSGSFISNFGTLFGVVTP